MGLLPAGDGSEAGSLAIKWAQTDKDIRATVKEVFIALLNKLDKTKNQRLFLLSFFSAIRM